MKKDFFYLSWITKLEDLERLEEPTRQVYRRLFEQLFDEFDEIFQGQESRHKQEIAILEKRIFDLINVRKSELEQSIIDSLITCYNLPTN
jgi:translation initiation factor 2 alpha subunit (eIF-2alpha)